MANYAIGDVQGCYQALSALLKKIDFNPQVDRLWFCGDLVNRGPNSLEVLRFIKGLAIPPAVVLGNHDLHMLAVQCNAANLGKHDTFQDVLTAEDADEICDWLRRQNLMYYDADLDYVMAHAGVAPQWSLTTALELANEVEQALRSEDYALYLKNAYGNSPSLWRNNLMGWTRLRCITHYFTRMRFCTKRGRLDLKTKGTQAAAPPGYLPWFKVPNRAIGQQNIVFGHWAALEGKADTPHVFALDTGCIWGGPLTAMRLEDKQLFSVKV